MSTFESFAQQGVTITPAEKNDGSLELVMAGAIEARDPGELLNPWFISVDAAAVAAGIARIDLDLERLSYASSSGILVFVKWITLANSHQQGYRIVIHYDPSVTWQKSSIPVLAKLAPRIVSVSARTG